MNEDIENSAAPAATEVDIGGSGNRNYKKWRKVFFLGVFFVAAIVVGVTLGVTLRKDSSNASTGAKKKGAVDQGADTGAGTDTAPPTDTAATPADTEEDKPTPVFEQKFLASDGPIVSSVRMINPGVANGYDSCDDLKEDIMNALKHYANSVIMSEKTNNWYERCDPNNPDAMWQYDDDDNFSFGKNETENEESATIDSNNTSPPTMSSTMGSTPTVGFDMDYGYNDDAPQNEAPAPAPGSTGGTEDSYETNNQVEGVDEADIIKSDGTWVFAGYGDILYAWNATDGSKGVSITRLHDTNDEDSDCDSFTYDDYYYGDSPMTVENEEETINATINDTASFNRRSLSCHKPKPRILSLLLQGTRLTSIFSKEKPYDPNFKDPIIGDMYSLDSQLYIQVYDVSNVPTDGKPLTLLAEREIMGSYNAARSFDSTGIIITTSSVNTYYLFAGDLYRYQDQYCGLNASEYEDLAVKNALNKTESFAEQMVNELQLDGSCDHIFQVAAMQSGENTTDHSDGNLLENFVHVFSFDMSEEYVNGHMPINTAGAFTSGYLNSVYVSQDFAAVLNVGYAYDPITYDWDEKTYVLGFKIGSSAPKPFCVGEVSGSPINQYAADLYDGHLRIATTKWNWSMDDDNSTSSTTNKLFVLKVPEESEGPEMTLTAETSHLGKKDESIHAVRFMGDRAYIVTFEQTDPFIVMDVSNHTNPIVVGELEIPGFSSYLHPIQIDGDQLMLGIGQQVNETSGWTIGVKISLFNITSSNPTEIDNFIDENAYSNAQHDFKSFRYLPLSRKLILHKSEYTDSAEGNFDGFVVYDVSSTGIVPSHEISHASSDDIYSRCWYSAHMPPRSLVFKSKVTTILSHTVLSTDLDTGLKEWELNLDEGLNVTDCRSYF